MPRRLLLVLTVSLAASAAPAVAGDATVQGYAEYREGDALVVDGQRVLRAPRVKLKLEGAARDWDSIPLGYEVEARGRRQADGSLLARQVEAKPNASALFEKQVQQLTDEAEEEYRRAGEVFQESGGRRKRVGRLYTSGPEVERVRAIVDDLAPPYIPRDRIRVYVVDNPEWNAFAMGNFSVYVHSGLLKDMDDDELAIVLGHEIAHATYEHTRRQFKKAMWVQIAALGVAIAAEDIDNRSQRAVVNLLTQFAAVVLVNGYGRDYEDQADRVGLRYAYEAGYDVARGPQMWRRFARKYGDGSKLGNFFFADHARSSVRATALQRQVALNYAGGPKPGTAYARRKEGLPALPTLPGTAPGTAPAVEAATAGVMTTTAAPPVAAALTGKTPARGALSTRIEVGMAADDVRRLLGEPTEDTLKNGRGHWTYPDLRVVFEGGKVKEVGF
jgi:Zn-dependent protease with chaperone function